MADDNDDQWLYGDQDRPAPSPSPSAPAAPPLDDSITAPDGNEDGTHDPPQNPEGEGDGEGEEPENDDSHFEDSHFRDETLEEPAMGMDMEREDDQDQDEARENGDSDSEDSEDDVKVIIGDPKSAPQTYATLNIKKGGFRAQSADKQRQTGKFTVEEFESVGTINGVPAQEFNIDVLEDKPWRKPGADLTDYFNYGFNEDTWRAYCERQKRMRIHESGAGLVPLGGNTTVAVQQSRNLTPILNDNSKYSVGYAVTRKAGPPPGRKMTGPIDVIGGRRDGSEDGPGEVGSPSLGRAGESAIQVLTADRRDYSRGKPYPDVSLPPPGAMPPSGDFFRGQRDRPPFYPPPYQEEAAWNWTPTEIKELTPSSNPPPTVEEPSRRSRERSSRAKSRSRSRSRSRRRKSRSRSPSSRHRSKKKSHRKDRNDSD